MTDAPLPPVPPSRPASAAPPARPEPQRDVLTPRMIESLIAIRPWARFLAIFGYVMAALTALAAVIALISALTISARHQKGAAMMLGMFAIYAVTAALEYFPSRVTHRYSKSIALAMNSRSKTTGVEQALTQEVTLWRFLGYASIATIAVGVLGAVVAVMVPLVLSRQDGKQRETVTAMKSVVDALAAYEQAEYKYPNASNIHGLAISLEPKYIASLPRLDGWHNTIVYRGSDCTTLGCRSYLLYSGGRNGELEEQPPYSRTGSRTKGYDGDIVVENGVFVRLPEGLEFR